MTVPAFFRNQNAEGRSQNVNRLVCTSLLWLALFFYLCAHAARALTFFQSRKKVSKEALLVRIFSAEFFLALRARKKLRVENAIDSLQYHPIFFGVRHSGTKRKDTKFSNYFIRNCQSLPLIA